MKRNPRRSIPAVSVFLSDPAFQQLIKAYSRESALALLRQTLAEFRKARKEPDRTAVVREVESGLTRLNQINLRRVVNATGTLIHTNLGRAVLGPGVIRAVAEGLKGYSNLEFDLEQGDRGRRAVHAEAKLNLLAGSEASLVVNNNAAAVMLAINTFALGKEVVVSRGELIEIGGSFRLPDIIVRAGGFLKEVGTTNKTRPSDYARAISKKTGLILKMHTSNYRIEGFTQEVGVAELAAIARKGGVPFMHDAGSGLFVDGDAWGLATEPDPRQSLREGAGLVSMSGDKLLGGPQAGLLLGKKRLVEEMKKNPMMRALRLGKLPLLALEAALLPYLSKDRVKADIPLFQQLSLSPEELKNRAARLAAKLCAANPALSATVTEAPGSVGGGAQPGRIIPSSAVALSHPSVSAGDLARAFRSFSTPVIGDYRKGRFLLNLLSLLEGEEEFLIAAAALLPR